MVRKDAVAAEERCGVSGLLGALGGERIFMRVALDCFQCLPRPDFIHCRPVIEQVSLSQWLAASMLLL